MITIIYKIQSYIFYSEYKVYDQNVHKTFQDIESLYYVSVMFLKYECDRSLGVNSPLKCNMYLLDFVDDDLNIEINILINEIQATYYVFTLG